LPVGGTHFLPLNLNYEDKTKILPLVLFLCALTIPGYTQPPEATTLVPTYLQAYGLHAWTQPFLKEVIVADSTAIVDDTTIYSDPMWIAPFAGIGVINFYVNAPDSDSVAVQYLYQLANYTGADKYWTTFETSDTLYLENALTTFYVEFDTIGAYGYLRVGFIPQANADTTFICDDNIEVWCWMRAKMDDYYALPFEPLKHIKNAFDDGYSVKSNGIEYK